MYLLTLAIMQENKKYVERLKEKARKARQCETLQNIDEYIAEQEEVYGQNYNFEAAFGDIVKPLSRL